MAVLGKPLDALTEADVQAYVENGVSEGRTLDYKRTLPGGKDAEKKEFLADVTALANAAGGHILYGVEEAGGVAVDVPGVEASDVDAEILRLDGSIRSGVEPRIPNVALRAVELANGRHVVVLDVPQSFARPHMVTFKGTNRFYLRHTAGKAPMTVDEIRTAFSLADSVIDRVRRFRLQRLDAIKGRHAPFPMAGAPYVVLHLLPLAMMDPAHRFDVTSETPYLPPLGYSGGDFRINFDGFASFRASSEGACRAYTQVYHSGAVEAVSTAPFGATQVPPMSGAGPLEEVGLIAPYRIEAELHDKATHYLRRQRELGVQVPVLAGLSLIGVRGYQLRTASAMTFDPTPIDRDDLITAEVLIDSYDVPLMRALRPAVDAIYNAGGERGSRSYDADGTWISR